MILVFFSLLFIVIIGLAFCLQSAKKRNAWQGKKLEKRESETIHRKLRKWYAILLLVCHASHELGKKKAHIPIKYTNFFHLLSLKWSSNRMKKKWNRIHLNAVWLSSCYYIISWGSGSCCPSIRQKKRVQRVINEKLLML